MAVHQQVLDLVYHAETTRGTRRKQEDQLSVLPDFLNRPPGSSPDANFRSLWPRLHYAGVFDGHGGDAVSRHCAEHMAAIIRRRLLSAISKDASTLDKLRSTDKRQAAAVEKHICQVLVDSFTHCDSTISPQDASGTGSTAVCAVLGPKDIWVANLGDSRAVIARRGGEVVSLTSDHKPERPDELNRIEAAGGHVFWNGTYRVMGNLAVSRALGDADLKPYGVISTPEVACVPRTGLDEFLILASDGLWVSLSNEQAVQCAQRWISQAQAQCNSRAAALAYAAQELVDAALQQGSKDNISVVLMDLWPQADTQQQRQQLPSTAHTEQCYTWHAGDTSSMQGGGLEQADLMRQRSGRRNSAACTGSEKSGVKSLMKQFRSWIKTVATH